MKINTFKSRLRVATTAAALCTLTACSVISGQSSGSAGTDNATTPSAGSNTNVKSLVVYFSRAGENYWDGDRKNLKKGNTAVLAEEIAKQTGADVYEIVAADPYSDDYGATVARNVREEDGGFSPRNCSCPAGSVSLSGGLPWLSGVELDHADDHEDIR